jgi:hypothetical protein
MSGNPGLDFVGITVSCLSSAVQLHSAHLPRLSTAIETLLKQHP